MVGTDRNGAFELALDPQSRDPWKGFPTQDTPFYG
jgi:hypothetical protein